MGQRGGWGLEPRVLRAASGVTAVSARTYEDAFERTGITPCEVAEIPIGWDPADVEALERRGAHRRLIPADGRVNICYTGTLLPLGIATLRAVLAGARALIERDPQLADRIRFYFFGTSNQTIGGDPPGGEDYLRLTPAMHGTDGFFVALFDRRANNSNVIPEPEHSEGVRNP